MHRRIKQYIDKYSVHDYDEDHLLFACHAAFPTGVTVHMLYQMWANFSVVPGRKRPMDPIVISDFLLSNLCRETSLGIFEINGKVREELLERLRADKRFGEKRVEALAFFLYQYIQRSVQERDFDTFRETQYWTAMAVISPNRVAHEIGQLLGQKIEQDDKGEILRLNKVLEQIGQQDKSLSNLLNYSRGLRDGMLERPSQANESFSKVIVVGEDVSGEQLSLKIPLMRSVVSEALQFKKAPSSAQLEAERRIQNALESGADELDLSGIPNLKRIPESINLLTQLKDLNASSCDLEVFPDLRELENLEALFIAFNKIKTLPNLLPASIKQIGVSENQITRFDHQILANDNVESLQLDNNQIKIFPGDFISVRGRSWELLLSGNPWLNFPQPFEDAFLEDYFNEYWKPMPSEGPTIQLVGLGYSLGEVLEDLRGRFSPWQESDVLGLTADQVTARYSLYNYLESTNTNIPLLYMGGESFQLAIGANDSDVEVLSQEDFASLLANRADYTNVVVLNLPLSAEYAEALIAVGFQAIIASRLEVEERQRFEFQEQFFEALTAGASIREAFDRVVRDYANPEEGGYSNFGYEQTTQQAPIQEQMESDLPPDFGTQISPWQIFEAPETKANWQWRLPELDILSESAAGPEEAPLEKELYKSLDQIKEAIRSKISNDDLAGACEIYEAVLDEESDMLNAVILQKARISSINAADGLGTDTQDSIQVQRTQVAKALLGFIRELEFEDLKEGILEDTISPENESESAFDPEDLSSWHTEQKLALTELDLMEWIDQFEPYLQLESEHYNAMVVHSSSLSHLEWLLKGNVINLKSLQAQRDQINEQFYFLIDKVDAADLRTDIDAPRSNDVLPNLQYRLKLHLRKNEWLPLWEAMEQSQKPVLANFDRYRLEWKYVQFDDRERRSFRDDNERNQIYRQLVSEICNFTDGLTLEVLLSLDEPYAPNSALEFFYYSILQLLPKGGLENILYFINDRLAATRGVNTQLDTWQGDISRIEKNYQGGSMSLEDYFQEWDRIYQQLEAFLRDELTEDALRSDYLAYEAGNLQDQINRLQAQKSYDFAQLNKSEAQLRMVQHLLTKSGSDQDYIVLNYGNSIVRLDRDEIVWVEALREGRIKVVTDDEEYEINITLARFLEENPQSQLQRCNRNIAVQIQRIQVIRRGEREVVIRYKDGSKVFLVGNAYYQALLSNEIKEEYIIFNFRNSIVRLHRDEIVWVETLEGGKIKVVTDDEEYEINITLARFLEENPQSRLQQCNRNVAVQIQRIQVVRPGEREVVVRYKDGSEVFSVGNVYYQALISKVVKTQDFETWRADQKQQLESTDLNSWIEQIEPYLQADKEPYNRFVVLSHRLKLVEYFADLEIPGREYTESERRLTQSYFSNLLDELNESAWYQNPEAQPARATMQQIRYDLKKAIREQNWSSFWFEMDKWLLPNLENFDRYRLEKKYNLYESNDDLGLTNFEISFQFFDQFIPELCAFLDEMGGQQIKNNAGLPAFNSIIEYFHYTVLTRLPIEKTEDLLNFLKDKLKPGRRLVNRFGTWEDRIRKLEDAFQGGSLNFENYLAEYDSIIIESKSFLDKEMITEPLLRADYLQREQQRLEEEIAGAENSEYLNTDVIDLLEDELQALRQLAAKASPAIEWQAVAYFYELITQNRLLQAAEELVKVLEDIPHKMSKQVADLEKRLQLLEGDRKKMPYDEYRKERGSLVNGLVISINEVLADTDLPEVIRIPDLLQYASDQVDDLIKKGALKGAFDYLCKALAPASSGMEDAVELSARYYELEAAQYRENVDYGSILEELSRFERYIYDILSSKFELRHDFVEREQARLEEELAGLSRQSKSKKFDLSQDGDYQRLRKALDFLRKFILEE